MTKNLKPPKTLYKYKSFNAATIDLLVSDKVYFANPSSFNDPLDTKPCVEPDLSIEQLENTLRQLVRLRVKAEMAAAAKTIKYRGPKTLEQIERLSTRHAETIIAKTTYNASNPEYLTDTPTAHKALLAFQLQSELLRRYDKGILSLATRYSCPLMWSHYGDEHNGLCLGYKVQTSEQTDLHKVSYGGSRLIKASTIFAMLNDIEGANKEVDDAVLLRKATDWRYEKEWRLIGQQGLADAPLELTDVTFGIRCTDAVKHTIANALEGRDKSVKFYEMREIHGTFKLKRHLLNKEQLSSHYPHCYSSCLDDFESLIEFDN